MDSDNSTKNKTANEQNRANNGIGEWGEKGKKWIFRIN